MIAVKIPMSVLMWLYVQKIFFVHVVPLLVGLTVAAVYPVGSRVAAKAGAAFWRVMLMSALGPALMLEGWRLAVRSPWTPLAYGLGYGLGAALLSRVHSLRVWPPKIITRRGAQAARRSA